MNIHEFIGELEGLKATAAEVPNLREQVEYLLKAKQEDGDRIARLESKLIDRTREIDQLRAEKRSVEAERDDAGFRLLEAQDVVNALTQAHRTAQATIVDALRAVEKPVVVPTPEPTPEVVTAAPSYAYASDGTVSPEPSNTEATNDRPNWWRDRQEDGKFLPVKTVEPVRPYEGKRYVDIPQYINLTDWLAGGGTQEDYEWRSWGKASA